MMDEIGLWLVRLATLLPELIGLWEAAKSPDPQPHLDASLALVRAMQNRRMQEELTTQTTQRPKYDLTSLSDIDDDHGNGD